MEGAGDGLVGGACPQLLQDAFAVGFHGFRADPELDSGFVDGVAVGG